MTVPAHAPVPAAPGSVESRYAQLLYASFDDGRRGGGWQIKEETRGLTAAEREEITARIVAPFDVGPPLPQFPTPDDLAARPARLYYAPVNTGGAAAAYWHTSDAGNDATGRPGNVMAHVLLDRDVTAPSDFRPIQLWKSVDWRRPYGINEVLAATLANSTVPQQNRSINPRECVDFLSDMSAPDRQTVFRVLLDAVARAMAGGPIVVLQLAHWADAPRWIAAVSFFMSVGTAQRFSWSTHDNARQVLADSRRGVHLICVVRPGADELARGGVVVLDEADQPNIGGLGGAHTTLRAQIPVSAWSVLAEGVLFDEDIAVRVIERMDAIAAEAGDRGLTPAWPLAVAVLAESELAEFHTDARVVVAEEAPTDIGSNDWIAGQVAEAVAATAPVSVPEAVAQLQRAIERDANVSRAAEQLLRMIIDDPQQFDTIDLTSVSRCAAVDLGRFLPDIPNVATMLDSGEPENAVADVHRGLRFAELLYRCGAPTGDTGAALQAIGTALSAIGAGFMADPEGAAPLLRDQDISGYVREVTLRPIVAHTPDLWRAMDLATWRWLFNEDRSAPEELGASLANPQPADLVLYPRYIEVLIAGPNGTVPIERLRRATGDAIFLALDDPQLPDEDCRELVSALNRTATIDQADLVRAFQQWPQRIAPATAFAPLCYWDDVSAELVTAVASPSALPEPDDRKGRQAIAAAQLRWLICLPGSLLVDNVESCLGEAAPTLLNGLGRDEAVRLAHVLASSLAALFIVGQSQGLSWADPRGPAVDGLRARLRQDPGTALAFLNRLTTAGLADPNWFVGQSYLAQIGLGQAAASVLGGEDGSRSAEYIERAIKRLSDDRSYQGPRDAADLRDICWPTVRELSAEQAEQFFVKHPKASKDWLSEYRRSARR